MKKPSIIVYSDAELRRLYKGAPRQDSFGPMSQNPYIAIRLSTDDSERANWLKTLPCPVIGIGDSERHSACDIVLNDETKIEILDQNIRRAPFASMVLVQHLRAIETLDINSALIAESFAYSTLQNGPEYLNWLATKDNKELPPNSNPYVLIERQNDYLQIKLNHPDSRNAIGVKMRDALCEALELALIDPEIQNIIFTANGSTFSIGGALEEFGEVSDSTTAHWIRNLRLPARLMYQLSAKISVKVNGAAIGAGIELAAFGGHVTASPKAWFQLPELKYGLIPGAGGTVSISRRIGRQKTAYMALTMEKIRPSLALDWGLIDGIED